VVLLTGASPDAARGASGRAPVTLRVMSFNIEWGGDNVSFDKVVEAVRAAGADLVGVQEAQGNIERLAAGLGWAHASRRLHVVSRFPLVEPPVGEGRYVLVAVAPGQVAALANVHLPSDPYGPDLVRRGEGPDAVLELERALRLPEIAPLLAPLRALADAGVPVFLTGDFNAPSFRDWSPAAVGTRPQLRYALDWPVSRAVEDAGFRDAFRVAHPDPVADPGLTWWARRPRIRDWNPEPADPEDRIDLLYVAGPVEVLASQVVGERATPGVAASVDPWPTDHRGVVATLSVVPAPLPPLVAVAGARVEAGDAVEVLYCCPASDAAGFLRAVADPAGANAAVSARAPLPEARGSLGVAKLSSHGLAPGRYEAVVLAAGRELGRAPFWLVPRGARVELSASRSTYRLGEPIAFRWRHAPGNRFDWIGLYRAREDGVEPAPDGGHVAWQHLGAQVAGALSFDRVLNGGSWPLAAGRYVAYLLEDDGYRPLARTEFTVTD
jgi:endonuclease/exonuclease/phosphatase family metal-dependent hydrolase